MLPAEWSPFFNNAAYALLKVLLWLLLVYALGYVAPRLAEKQLSEAYQVLFYTLLIVGVAITFLILLATTPNGLGAWTALATGLVGWAAYTIHFSKELTVKKK